MSYPVTAYGRKHYKDKFEPKRGTCWLTLATSRTGKRFFSAWYTDNNGEVTRFTFPLGVAQKFLLCAEKLGDLPITTLQQKKIWTCVKMQKIAKVVTKEMRMSEAKMAQESADSRKELDEIVKRWEAYDEIQVREFQKRHKRPPTEAEAGQGFLTDEESLKLWLDNNDVKDDPYEPEGYRERMLDLYEKITGHPYRSKGL